MYNLNKIVSIGDLHGDYKIFMRILKMCNLINDKLDWIGLDTYVVQTGDILDGRRPGIKLDPEFKKESGEVEIMELISKLDNQAKMKNGRVIALIGNHELYSYYFKEDLSGYTKKSDIQKFTTEYKISRQRYLSPGGRMWSEIDRPLILQLGEFLFVHGSITDKLIKYGLDKTGKVDIDKINKETNLWLDNKGKIPKYLIETDEENPVFSRKYSIKKNFNKKECDKFQKQLENFDGVNYVVVGHTTFDSINSTCKRSLIRTDIELSRAFGGNLNRKVHVLEIIQDGVSEPNIKIVTPQGKIVLR
jgi:dihydrofolate reductase